MANIPVEIGEMISGMSDAIPKLIAGAIDAKYSGEAGTKVGQAVGNLYKELIASGVPEDAALGMARDYMFAFTQNGKDIVEMLINRRRGSDSE